MSCSPGSYDIDAPTIVAKPSGGYAWKYNIIANGDNYGYAYVKVRTESGYNPASGDSDAFVTYLHDEEVSNVSVSISPGGFFGSMASIGFSGTNEVLSDPVQW